MVQTRKQLGDSGLVQPTRAKVLGQITNTSLQMIDLSLVSCTGGNTGDKMWMVWGENNFIWKLVPQKSENQKTNRQRGIWWLLGRQRRKINSTVLHIIDKYLCHSTVQDLFGLPAWFGWRNNQHICRGFLTKKGTWCAILRKIFFAPGINSIFVLKDSQFIITL